MKLTVKKGDILRELNLVQGVVERRSTIPILSNLLLETAGNRVQITATDLDVSLQCSCSATVAEEGALAVPAKKLFDIVRLLPESEIEFSLAQSEWMTVTCAKSTFKLAGLPKDNFPAVPALPWAQPAGKKDTTLRATLPGSVLRKMINRTIFAITQDESRYTLSGALAVFKPGSISMVTTDGHRLALVLKTIDIEGINEELRILIPKKTLSELLKLITDELLIGFGKDENHLFFQVGPRTLVSRILAGQFPNYEMVIPKENDKAVAFNTVQLGDAIRRVDVLADERSHAIKLVLSKDLIEITASSSDSGEAREVVSLSSAAESEAPSYKGERLEIGFNAQYLLDFLAAANSESVLFGFRDNETQVLLRPVGDDYDYQYVIMPMRL